MVPAEDEAALIARGQEIARQEGIYLAMSMGTVYQDDSPHEVKLIIADPQGQIVLEHYKYGGQSVEGFKPGDGILRTVETPYGRTVAAVDHFTTSERVIVAQVPSVGVFTLYPVIGDLFGWLAVAGLAAIIVVAVAQGRRAKQPAPAAQPEAQPATTSSST